jgi:trimeric autotransporter adhesin
VAHAAEKARLITERQRLEEEIQQVRFAIQQEETAYEAVRRRLTNERNAALLEVARLQEEQRRAEVAHNTSLARVEAARAEAEGALAQAQATADKEAKETRAALARMVKEAQEAREADERALKDTKEAHKTELAGLNANITSLADAKTKLSATVQNLAADRARAVQSVTELAGKLEEARKLLSASDGDKRALQVTIAGLEVQSQQANDLLAEVQRTLTITQRRIKDAKSEADLAGKRKLELEKKLDELRDQQKRLAANAEAIEKAMAAIKVDASGVTGEGQRAVQEALFKLGQQMEATQAEKARLEDAAAEAERDIATLMASKVTLEQAVAGLNARYNSARELGVTETGADGPLAAFMAAQAAMDVSKEGTAKEEAAAARDRAGASPVQLFHHTHTHTPTPLNASRLADAADSRDRATAEVKAAVDSTGKAADATRVKLAGVRGGALPKELTDQLTAARQELAAANALTTADTTAAERDRRAADERQRAAVKASTIAEVAASLDNVKAKVADEAAKAAQRAAAAAPGGVAPSPMPATHVTRVFMDGDAPPSSGGAAAGQGVGADSLLTSILGFSDLAAAAAASGGGGGSDIDAGRAIAAPGGGGTGGSRGALTAAPR